MNGAAYLLLASDAAAVSARPLVGRVRVMPGGYFGDDTGYRRVLFDCDFPLFNRWCYDEREARAGLEATAHAGFQGSRVFHLLGFDENHYAVDPNYYFYQREVGKAEFRQAAVPCLRFMRDLGLKVVLTAGHVYAGSFEATVGYMRVGPRIVLMPRGPIVVPRTAQPGPDERAWFEEFTGIIRDADLSDVVAAIEVLGNEVSMNRGWLAYDVVVAMQYAKPLQEIIRRNLPGVLLTNGDFGNESTENPDGTPVTNPTLISSAAGAECMDIHPMRDMPNSIRHVHTIWHATHYQAACLKPIHEGEEPGENAPYPENTAHTPRNPGGDVYIGCDDPYYLHTRLALGQMTGQLVSYLNGPGVRRWAPLDSTIYFHKIPPSLMPIPEDIPTWRDENNPSWFIKGKQFVYCGLLDWGQLFTPPHKVASVMFYDIDGPAGGTVVDGRPSPPSGWRGGIVTGTFL